MFEALECLMEGKTAIVIAHRLATVRKATSYMSSRTEESQMLESTSSCLRVADCTHTFMIFNSRIRKLSRSLEDLAANVH